MSWLLNEGLAGNGLKTGNTSEGSSMHKGGKNEK